jgi:hypothetical protein
LEVVLEKSKWLIATLFLTFLSVFAPSISHAEDDQPGEKPNPTLYSHEEGEEGDESLIRDEKIFVIGGLVVGVGTIGFLFYRRGKSED